MEKLEWSEKRDGMFTVISKNSSAMCAFLQLQQYLLRCFKYIYHQYSTFKVDSLYVLVSIDKAVHKIYEFNNCLVMGVRFVD